MSPKAAISGPLASGVSAGFSILRASREGFVEDSLNDREYNDKDTIAARGTLAFDPSSNVLIDLTADYAQDDAFLTSMCCLISVINPA